MITSLITYKLFESLFETERNLNEGLIMTHDPRESIDIITRFMSSDNTTLIDINIKKNKLLLSVKINKIDKFISFIKLVNTLGYFISTIISHRTNLGHNVIENDKWDKFKTLKFTQSNIEKIYFQYDLELEAKYDITTKDIPNILYHVTEDRYVDKILKNGLIPKSVNSLSSHPERIYCAFTVEAAKLYVKNKKRLYSINHTDAPIGNEIDKKLNMIVAKFVLLEINLKNLDIIFYNDPNFDAKGIYTYDNISPERIKVLDTDFKFIKD